MKSTKTVFLKLALVSICTLGMNAFADELCVSIAGPGGHSNGAYGNTSALHAASRAIMEIHKAVPDATIVDLKGGNSVNAIAADTSFKVRLSGSPEKQKKEAEAVKLAVAQGCAEENAFRNVKEGEVEKGLRKDIRFTIE